MIPFKPSLVKAEDRVRVIHRDHPRDHTLLQTVCPSSQQPLTHFYVLSGAAHESLLPGNCQLHVNPCAPWQDVSGPVFFQSLVGNRSPESTKEPELCHTQSIVSPTLSPLYTELGRRPGSQRLPLLPLWLRVGVPLCSSHTTTDALVGE